MSVMTYKYDVLPYSIPERKAGKEGWDDSIDLGGDHTCACLNFPRLLYISRHPLAIDRKIMTIFSGLAQEIDPIEISSAPH